MKTKKRKIKKGNRRTIKRKVLLNGSVLRYKKGEKEYKDYGEGLRYMVFDGKGPVFKYVGDMKVFKQ